MPEWWTHLSKTAKVVSAALTFVLTVASLVVLAMTRPWEGEGPPSYTGDLSGQFSAETREMVDFLHEHADRVVFLDVTFDRETFEPVSNFGPDVSADWRPGQDIEIWLWRRCPQRDRETAVVADGAAVEGCEGSRLSLPIGAGNGLFLDDGVRLRGHYAVEGFVPDQQMGHTDAATLRPVPPESVSATAVTPSST